MSPNKNNSKSSVKAVHVGGVPIRVWGFFCATAKIKGVTVKDAVVAAVTEWTVRNNPWKG